MYCDHDERAGEYMEPEKEHPLAKEAAKQLSKAYWDYDECADGSMDLAKEHKLSREAAKGFYIYSYTVPDKEHEDNPFLRFLDNGAGDFLLKLIGFIIEYLLDSL